MTAAVNNDNVTCCRTRSTKPAALSSNLENTCAAFFRPSGYGKANIWKMFKGAYKEFGQLLRVRLMIVKSTTIMQLFTYYFLERSYQDRIASA